MSWQIVRLELRDDGVRVSTFPETCRGSCCLPRGIRATDCEESYQQSTDAETRDGAGHAKMA